jgi:hypothetical protein
LKSVNKLIAYGAATLFFSLTSGSLAATSPNSDIKGPYNCLLTGGFIAQTSSSALAQFSAANGKVTGGAGELKVVVGGEDQGPSLTTNPTQVINRYSFQICNYTPSGGSYSLNVNGAGTLSVNWTASAENGSAPIPCTDNITTNFDILVNSRAAFILESTDLIQSSCGTSFGYSSCGSTFHGTCQAAKP